MEKGRDLKHATLFLRHGGDSIDDVTADGSSRSSSEV